MSVNISVNARVKYEVKLNKTDMQKIKEYLLNEKGKDLSVCDEDDILAAIADMSCNGDIDIWHKDKCIESDFVTDSFEWSSFEDKTAQEILIDNKE